jgi:hypothetical protein
MVFSFATTTARSQSVKRPRESAPSYLERGSSDHLDRSTEKSSACAMAPDPLEQNISGMKDASLKPRTTWDGGKII